MKQPPTLLHKSWLPSSIEPLEARIAPANFVLPNGQGPFTLEVDNADGHVHILNGIGAEVFDQGVGPYDELFITGGSGGVDSLAIINSGTALAFTGTLSVNIPGRITVTGGLSVGTTLSLTTTGSEIIYGSVISLGAADATLSAVRSITLNGGASLSTDSGDIILQANLGGGQNGSFVGIALNGATITTTGTGTIQLTGTGGNTSNNNDGISLFPGSVISSTSNLPTAGTITLTGTAGAGIASNRGVVLSGNGTTSITSTSGDISITGLGSPGSTGGNNVGVHLLNGAAIVSNGTGVNAATITINGTGGAGVDFNHGVFVDGGGADPQITSVDGAISITGTALAGANGQGARGISIEQGAQIVATGGVANAQTITLQGTGGGGSDNRHGVFINQTGTLVSAAEGFVMITGTGGAGGAGNANNGVRISAAATVSASGSNGVIITGTEGGGANNAGISLNGGVVTATGPAGVEFSANNLNIDAAANVNGGPGGVYVHPRLSAIPIDLGGADVPGMTLGISTTELGRLAGGTLRIGDPGSGSISLTAGLSLNQNLILRSAGVVSGVQPLGLLGSSNLTINATAGIDLTNTVTLQAGTASFTAGPATTITLDNALNEFGTVHLSGSTISIRDDAGFDLGTVSSDAGLFVDSSGAITQSGVISGGGGVTKLGLGTLGLTSTNTYTGSTTVTSGIVQVGANSATGSLGTGPVFNSGTLLFVRNNSHTVSNEISGNGVLQNSLGTMTLTAVSSYTGATIVAGGTLLVNGQLTGTSVVTVAATGNLGGTGTINAPVNNSGRIAPGVTIGTLTTGNVGFQPASQLDVTINGLSPQHDQLSVTGTVNLGGATLNTSGTIGSTAGQQIVLIANDGNDPVVGTFAGLAEGAPVDVNGVVFNITYIGGTNGNDVVLTQPAATTEVVFIGTELSINDITGAGRNDAIKISMNSSGTILTITDPGAIFTASTITTATVSNDLHTVTVPTAVFGTTPVRILGGAGDDTLTVDYSQGIFVNGVAFFGGPNGITGDQIAVTGGPSIESASIDFSAIDTGSLTFSTGGRIDYLGAESVDFDRPSDQTGLTYRFFAGQTINISDTGSSKTRVASSAAASITVRHPTTSLGIFGGQFSADIFNLNSLPDDFSSTLSIDGDAGADIINVAGGLPTLPRLTLRAATVSALPALSLGTGGLDVVALGSNITVGGNIDSTGPVSLVTVDAITNPAGFLKAPTVTLQAADGITLALDGGSISASNSVAGNVTLSAVNNTPTLSNIAPGPGVASFPSGSFRLGKTDAITRTAALDLGGDLDLNGFLQGAAALSGEGSITNSASALSTLTVGVGGASGTFTGTISGHIALEKVGTGTQTIGGAYTAVDGTTITSGTLRFTAFGSALDGAFTLDGGTLTYDLPAISQSLSPNILLTADSSIGVGAGKTVTLTDLITGPAGLTKVGDGKLVLANQQNSFGPAEVRIHGGTLQVATDGALGDVGNDVAIENATFAASAGFGSGRNFSKRGGTATIDAQVPKLTLINQAIIPADFTPTNPANLEFAFTYADTTTEPDNKITVGNTAVALSGGGTLIIHRLNPTTIDTIELAGATSSTKLVIEAVDPNVVTTVLRVVINDPTPGGIASIGSIVLGENVRLGDGVRDSVPDLFVEGKVGKVQLDDVNSHAIVRLGESLPHGVTGDRKTPSTKNNAPELIIDEVLGPGVLIDLTPSDLPPVSGDLVGGGGLGKVVVTKWEQPGFVRTTQSIKSFKQLQGDNLVVFDVDKFHVGSDTQANVGSMTIQNGSWGSSGSEIEGEIGSFNADEFLLGATLTAAGMGKFSIDAGAFAGLLTLTDPDAPGIPTFTVNGNFSGTVDSESPLRKIKVKGDFTGELEAPFIGAITAYAFLGSNVPGEENTITATDGGLGTLTATAGVVKNFSIVTDQVFKGFNIKLAKLTADTIGIDNVQIQAASIGNISVNLAAAPTAGGIDLIGIRDSSFVTTGTGATKTTTGSIGNVTVTLTGAAVGASASGIVDSTFDALVTTNEFGTNPASTVNPLGKITVRIAGQGGASVGLDGATFSGNTIGTTAVIVSKAASGSARAIDGATFAATGAIGALLADGDATSTQVHDLQMNAGTNIGAVTVKAKTAPLGTLDSSALLAGQALALAGTTTKDLLAELARASLGAINVTGSITNTQLVAGGSIGAVTAGGSLTDSLILAGAKLGTDAALGGSGNAADSYQRAASIAAVTVKGAAGGTFARTSIVAGVNPGNTTFGDSDDTTAAAAGILPTSSAIGPITIGGATSHGPASGSAFSFAIQAAAIKSLKLGTVTLPPITNALFLDTSGPAGENPGDVLVRLR